MAYPCVITVLVYSMLIVYFCALRISKLRILTLLFCFLFVQPQQKANDAIGMTVPETRLDAGEQIVNFSQWEALEKSEHTLSYQRWLTLHNGRQVRQRRSAMLFSQLSAQRAIHFIRDYKKMPLWLSSAEESRLIARIRSDFWVTFTMFNLPWPLRNKFLIVENKEKIHRFLPLTSIYIESTEAYQPPYTCSVNDFGHYEGLWQVYEISPGITYVEFTAYSSAEPQFPRWIQDPIVNRAFLKSMENFYELLRTSA